jgi:hypothetical protein
MKIGSAVLELLYCRLMATDRWQHDIVGRKTRQTDRVHKVFFVCAKAWRTPNKTFSCVQSISSSSEDVTFFYSFHRFYN